MSAALPKPRARMPWQTAPRSLRWHERFSTAVFVCMVVIALAAIVASDAWWLLP